MPPKQSKASSRSLDSQAKDADDNVFDPAYLTSKLSKDELIKRLKKLARALTETEQNCSDDVKKTITASAKAFASESLIRHRDEHVRLLVACCFADIFKILAPDPPYSDKQLRDIFELILAQLRGLADTDSDAFTRHFYLLETLAVVKSFVLLFAMDAEDLLVELFQMCFEIINEKHNTRVESHMLDILSACLEEVDQMPTQLLDSILMPLTPKCKKSNKAAYRLAGQLLNRCADRLSGAVSEFMNSIMFGGPLSESKLKSEDPRLLLFELFKVNADLILTVIPNLAQELRAEDVSQRLQAVELVGGMASRKGSLIAEDYEPLFQEYVSRFVDLTTEVRCKMVEMCKYFLINHPVNGRAHTAIVQALKDRCQDPEDKVRKTVIGVLCETATAHPLKVPSELLQTMSDRVRDKKAPIRLEAIHKLALLYSKHCARQFADEEPAEEGEDEEDEGSAAVTQSVSYRNGLWNHFGWIPAKILSCYPSRELQAEVEQLLDEILVVGADSKQRVYGLVAMTATVCGELGASKALETLLQHKKFAAAALRDYLNFRQSKRSSQDPASESTRKRIFERLLAVAPDTNGRLNEDVLHRLDEIKDAKVFKGLQSLVDMNDSYKKTRETLDSLLKKLGTGKGGLGETLLPLLRRSSNLMLCSDQVDHAVEFVTEWNQSAKSKSKSTNSRSKKGTDESSIADPNIPESRVNRVLGGLFILHLAAKQFPVLLSSQWQQLTPLFTIATKVDSTIDSESSLTRIAEHALGIVGEVLNGCETEAVTASQVKSLRGTLEQLCHNGSARIGKYAVKALDGLCKNNRDVVFEQLTSDLVRELDLTSDSLATRFSSLSAVAGTHAEVYVSHHEKVMQFLTQRLLVSEGSKSKSKSANPLLTAARVHGVKLLGKFAEALADVEDDVTASEDVQSSMAVLFRIIDHEGALLKGTSSDDDKIKLRSACLSAVLRVFRHPKFVQHIKPSQFQSVVMMIQDTDFEVRQKVQSLLHRNISRGLPPTFAVSFCLSAIDPDKENVIRSSAALQSLLMLMRRRVSALNGSVTVSAQQPESLLPYLVYVLAHHPDLPEQAPDYKDFRKYTQFFFESLWKSDSAMETFAFVVKLLEVLRRSTDVTNPSSKSHIIVVDVALNHLRSKYGAKVSTANHPGEIYLPASLFEARKGQPLQEEPFSIPSAVLTPQKSGKGKRVAAATPVSISHLSPIEPIQANDSPLMKSISGSAKKRSRALESDSESDFDSKKVQKKKPKTKKTSKAVKSTSPGSRRTSGRTAAVESRDKTIQMMSQEDQEDEDDHSVPLPKPLKAAKPKMDQINNDVKKGSKRLRQEADSGAGSDVESQSQSQSQSQSRAAKASKKSVQTSMNQFVKPKAATVAAVEEEEEPQVTVVSTRRRRL